MPRKEEPKGKKLSRGDVARLALADYCATHDTAKAIAARHGISVKRLRALVDAAGNLQRRPRGRRPLLEPTADQQAILSRCGSVPLTQLAREVSKSKQYISQLTARWPGWVGLNPAPSVLSLPVHTRTTSD